MSGHDPITYKMYVKQLAKIKTRKNQYLPKETASLKLKLYFGKALSP